VIFIWRKSGLLQFSSGEKKFKRFFFFLPVADIQVEYRYRALVMRGDVSISKEISKIN